MAKRYFNGKAREVVAGFRCDNTGKVFPIIQGKHDTGKWWQDKCCYNTLGGQTIFVPTATAYSLSANINVETQASITNHTNLIGNTPNTYATFSTSWAGQCSVKLQYNRFSQIDVNKDTKVYLEITANLYNPNNYEEYNPEALQFTIRGSYSGNVSYSNTYLYPGIFKYGAHTYRIDITNVFADLAAKSRYDTVTKLVDYIARVNTISFTPDIGVAGLGDYKEGSPPQVDIYTVGLYFTQPE